MANIQKKKSELPKYVDLVKDLEKFQDLDEFNLLLNQQPPQQWIAYHPFIKDKQGNLTHAYIPIDKVEFLLRRIFKDYKIEITGQGTSFNGVWVTVRIHYLNPATNDWSFHDGIGAIQLQTKQGSSPADLASINNGALSMAYPHAKTLAIKDACDHFGKLFGSDLNRKATLDYSLDAELQSKHVKQAIDTEQMATAIVKIKRGDLTIEELGEIFELTEQDIKDIKAKL
jgi:hypothetical protein